MERRTPGKPQSRSEARESGAKGVLDGGILPPFPPFEAPARFEPLAVLSAGAFVLLLAELNYDILCS